MNPATPQAAFGTGSPLLGGTSALQRSIQARAPQSSLNQQSPASPGFQPGLQVPANPPMPNKSPMTMGGGQATASPVVQPQPTMQPQMQQSNPISEAEQIVGALIKRLTHHSNLAKQNADMQEASQAMPQSNSLGDYYSRVQSLTR